MTPRLSYSQDASSCWRSFAASSLRVWHCSICTLSHPLPIQSGTPSILAPISVPLLFLVVHRIPASIQSYPNSTSVWSFPNYDTELSPNLRILLGSILWSSHRSVLIDPNFYLNLLLIEKGAGITFVISSHLECIVATETLLSTHNRFMGLGDFIRPKFNGTKFLQSIIHPGCTESSEIILADIETHYIRKFWWDSNFISNYAHITTELQQMTYLDSKPTSW
jgi:hypothetical protein